MNRSERNSNLYHHLALLGSSLAAFVIFSAETSRAHTPAPIETATPNSSTVQSSEEQIMQLFVPLVSRGHDLPTPTPEPSPVPQPGNVTDKPEKHLIPQKTPEPEPNTGEKEKPAVEQHIATSIRETLGLDQPVYVHISLDALSQQTRNYALSVMAQNVTVIDRLIQAAHDQNQFVPSYEPHQISNESLLVTFTTDDTLIPGNARTLIIYGLDGRVLSFTLNFSPQETGQELVRLMLNELSHVYMNSAEMDIHDYPLEHITPSVRRLLSEGLSSWQELLMLDNAHPEYPYHITAISRNQMLRSLQFGFGQYVQGVDVNALVYHSDALISLMGYGNSLSLMIESSATAPTEKLLQDLLDGTDYRTISPRQVNDLVTKVMMYYGGSPQTEVSASMQQAIQYSRFPDLEHPPSWGNRELLVGGGVNNIARFENSQGQKAAIIYLVAGYRDSGQYPEYQIPVLEGAHAIQSVEIHTAEEVITVEPNQVEVVYDASGSPILLIPDHLFGVTRNATVTVAATFTTYDLVGTPTPVYKEFTVEWYSNWQMSELPILHLNEATRLVRYEEVLTEIEVLHTQLAGLSAAAEVIAVQQQQMDQLLELVKERAALEHSFKVKLAQ